MDKEKRFYNIERTSLWRSAQIHKRRSCSGRGDTPLPGTEVARRR